MAIKQLSVLVDNKKGALADITDLLAKADVDLRAMSIADTQDYGILRLIVSDINKAVEVLTATEVIATITEVIAVAIDDRPGGLAKVLRVLADNHINMEYLYAFTAASRDHAYVVFRVEDNAAAEKVLTDNGIPLLEGDITKL